MFYTIRHLTRFRYASPVSESLMELRMHPRTEGSQRCLSFHVMVDPRARVNEYRDYLGNAIHHFDVPGNHAQLRIVAESLVEVQPPLELPKRLDESAWQDLDNLVAAGDYWEMLMPSQYAQPGPVLDGLIRDLGVTRRDDPLKFTRELNSVMYSWFDYVPKTTKVDSPIDHAIEARKGVCQDFAHIMAALLRHVKIPCRYVSGYVCPRSDHRDRSLEGATHAWVEALLPQGLGWVGFDPTNDLLAGERHIRTAIGRDYADVPPTKGIFKGKAASEMSVAVRVVRSDSPGIPDVDLAMSEEWPGVVKEAAPSGNRPYHRHLQQQQQQQ